MFGPNYDLRPGEAIHFVPPPFRDERMEYCRSSNPGSAEGPAAMCIAWTDGRQKVEAGFYGKIGIADLVCYVLQVYRQDVECEEAIAKWPVRGDFVIDRSAEPEEYSAAMEGVIGSMIGDEISVTFREIEHPALVFSGKWSDGPEG